METIDNKIMLEELIKEKINETKRINPELNISFYLLNRNFLDGTVSIPEAQSMYEMYVKEVRIS
jgi:hypothetical protein